MKNRKRQKEEEKKWRIKKQKYGRMENGTEEEGTGSNNAENDQNALPHTQCQPPK